MLGLIQDLIHTDYIEGSTPPPPTPLVIISLVITTGITTGRGAVCIVDTNTVGYLGLASLNQFDRVPGLTVSFTAVKTHGENGVDITDITETVILYAYRSAANFLLYLSGSEVNPTDGNTLDLTSSPFLNMAATGDDNEYIFTINYIAKDGFGNSGSESDTATLSELFEV
jgi:hypothetical protein